MSSYPSGRELNDVERHILACAAAGVVACFDRDDDPSDPAARADWSGRQVSADFVRLVAKGKKKWPVADSGVRLSGLRILGRLDLTQSALQHSLGFQRCLIEEPISLEGATTRSLAFVRSRVGPIAAGGLYCDGSLELSQSAVGAIDLSGATITGDLTADSALLAGGLDTDGAIILGDVYPAEVRVGHRPSGTGGLLGRVALVPDPTTEAEAADELHSRHAPDEAPAPEAADTSTSEERDTVDPAQSNGQSGRSTPHSDDPSTQVVPSPPRVIPLSERIRSELPPPIAPPFRPDEQTMHGAGTVLKAAPSRPRSARTAQNAATHRGRLLSIRNLSWFSLAVFVAGVVFAAIAPDGVFRSNVDGRATTASCGEDVECFNAIAYAVDTITPVIDLDQTDSWHPDGGAPWGDWYRYGRWFSVVLGWTLALLFALAGIDRFRSRS